MGLLPEYYPAGLKQPADAGRWSMNSSRSAVPRSTQTGDTRSRQESLSLVRHLAGVERRTHGCRRPSPSPPNIAVQHFGQIAGAAH